MKGEAKVTELVSPVNEKGTPLFAHSWDSFSGISLSKKCRAGALPVRFAGVDWQ